MRSAARREFIDGLEPSFFVYGLFRRDTGGICYVGKGHHRGRALGHAKGHSKKENPQLWHIIRKHGVDEDFLIAGLTEAEAFAEERRLITKIGRWPNGPLANKTDGGEGPTGYVHSLELRAAQSARQKVVTSDPEWRTAQSARMKAWSSDPDWLAAKTALLRDFNADPESRAANSARMKARHADPEFRAAQSARMKVLASDPEWLATKTALLRASKAARHKDLTLYPAGSTNLRRCGSHGYRSLQIIIDNPGIGHERFIELGGRSRDLRYDIAHSNVNVINASALAEAAD